MTRPRVVFTERADQDVDELFAYVARENLDAAVRLLSAIEETASVLARFPGLGRPRRFRQAALRDLRSRAVTGFLNFLVFYRAIDDGIEVVRVLHGARDVPRALTEDEAV